MDTTDPGCEGYVLPCVHMERIGVRELRQNASDWIRRARAGERIEITNRGQVVAVLGPPPSGDTIGRLRDTGRLKPATFTAPLPAAVRTRRPASAALAEQRADR